MNFYFFPLNEDDLKHYVELFACVPYLPENYYDTILKQANFWNEGLYTKLRFSVNLSNKISQTLENCDIAIIPFKYNKEDIRIKEFCNLAQLYKKPVVCFYNDDSNETFDLPNNLILFRTSLHKSKINKQERIFPVLVADHYTKSNKTHITNSIVTFCGHTEHGRHKILNKISNIYSNTNFLLRSGFWAPEIASKLKARRDYYTNLLSGTFTLCMKGNGNFSYRFYEALCFGRIPIFIDTDCLLPFTKDINWTNHIITLNNNELEKIPDMIYNCKINPSDNRELWEKYFSAEGYFNNFVNELNL